MCWRQSQIDIKFYILFYVLAPIWDWFQVLYFLKNKVLFYVLAPISDWFQVLYIDQSQSFNTFMAQPNVSKLSSMHFYSWKRGLKTGQYPLTLKWNKYLSDIYSLYWTIDTMHISLLAPKNHRYHLGYSDTIRVLLVVKNINNIGWVTWCITYLDTVSSFIYPLFSSKICLVRLLSTSDVDSVF